MMIHSKRDKYYFNLRKLVSYSICYDRKGEPKNLTLFDGFHLHRFGFSGIRSNQLNVLDRDKVIGTGEVHV